MEFWKPGMPGKAFDTFSIERVKTNLENGSCTEFPLDDYIDYLVEKIRTTTNANNFAIELIENQHHMFEESNSYCNYHETYNFPKKDIISSYYKFSTCVKGTANLKHDTLFIGIWIGSEIGFTNDKEFYQYTYKVNWFND